MFFYQADIWEMSPDTLKITGNKPVNNNQQFQPAELVDFSRILRTIFNLGQELANSLA